MPGFRTPGTAFATRRTRNSPFCGLYGTILAGRNAVHKSSVGNRQYASCAAGYPSPPVRAGSEDGRQDVTTWQRTVIGVAILLALVRISGVTEGLNRWLTDAHWRYHASHHPTPFPKDILVVAIDDKTVKHFGRLRYWSRARYAALLGRLGEARAVGLDVLFTEADDRDPKGDALLAKALRANGRTALACYEWSEPRPYSDDEGKRLLAAIERFPRSESGIGGLPVLNYLVIEPPVPVLMASAAATGTTIVNADADGVYRSPVMVKVAKGRALVPHIALAVACIAEGAPLEKALGPTGLSIGGREVPLQDGAIILEPIAKRGGGYLPGPGSRVPTISFVDALSMRPDEFRDKIVLVGETVTGTTDIRPNPLDNGLRGVELNAEILANLLHLPPVRPIPMGIEWALIIAGVAAPLVFYERLRPRTANLGSVGALIALVAAMEIAFWRFRLIPSWSPVMIGFFGATLMMAAQRYAQEEAVKQNLRRSFSVYVAPELVEAIVSNPGIARQEGARRRVVVLFADVRDFTPYCERHEPEFVVRQMREYLEEMTAAVDECGGVLDKYIGDEVMALFGPFLPKSANAGARAVRCAMEMQDRLERLNLRWARAEMPPFRIGIGIHAGDAIVGNIGASRRMQYTAIGDTVNLASRLQNLTKDLESEVLISRAVMDEAQENLRDSAEFIARGDVSVRGREQPVPVYEVRRAHSRQEDGK